MVSRSFDACCSHSIARSSFCLQGNFCPGGVNITVKGNFRRNDDSPGSGSGGSVGGSDGSRGNDVNEW